jgi:hypothetical protein
MSATEEELRRARELAWDEGYSAGKQHDPRLRSTWKTNPYRKYGVEGLDALKE